MKPWFAGILGLLLTVAAAGADFAPDAANEITFAPQTARFVRFVILGSAGQPCIDELEVYAGGKENLALAAQSKLNGILRLQQNYDEMLTRQQSEFKALQDARTKLEAKLTTTKQERDELQALLDLARSKEITVKAIKSLDDLVGTGDADIARVAEGIRERLDRASAQSEMMASSLDTQMDQVLERSSLEAQLAERKARLGLQ